MQQNRAAAEEKPVMLTETLQPLRSELLMDPGEGEYTELALECLDLKAQEELLSPPLSGDNTFIMSPFSFIDMFLHVI